MIKVRRKMLHNIYLDNNLLGHVESNEIDKDKILDCWIDILPTGMQTLARKIISLDRNCIIVK